MRLHAEVADRPGPRQASRLEFSFPQLLVNDVPDRLAVTPQYLMPKRLLTVFAGKVACWHGGAVTHATHAVG